MPMPSGSRLSSEQRISVLCGMVCGLLAVALPISCIFAWSVTSPEYLAETFHAPKPLSGTIEPWQRASALAANLPSALLFSFGLWRARDCLLAFSRGQFFGRGAVNGLRDFACAVFWAVILGFVEASITSVIVSWTNGPGLRLLSFGVHSQQVFLALYAGIFWVVAAAMARAAAMAHENEQFV